MTELPAPARLVVLVSGHGSNLQAILEACTLGELPAQVVAVISDKPSAYGLERARQAGLPALAQSKPKGQDRLIYDAALANLAATFEPDWIVLAGWMRILSAAFLNFFPGRVVNLHPALPGSFPGTHAIERAHAAYRRGEITHTGVMVHLVPDEGIDTGPVLAQQLVPIHPGEPLEALTARMHTTEHTLLIQALAALCKEHQRQLS
jgi:phosphoribosylglycinamide formyltransferase 1